MTCTCAIKQTSNNLMFVLCFIVPFAQYIKSIFNCYFKNYFKAVCPVPAKYIVSCWNKHELESLKKIVCQLTCVLFLRYKSKKRHFSLFFVGMGSCTYEKSRG